MKYIKTFEEINNTDKLEVGNYVICEWYEGHNNEKYKIFNDFINNNIGKLVEITGKLFPGTTHYIIQYDNIPFELNNFKIFLSNNEYGFSMKAIDIIKYSKNKEELKAILQANKFNI